MKVAILDDYANAALTLADWSTVTARASLHVFNDHLADDEIAEVLAPFDVICTLRERTTISEELIARLLNLKMIVVTDPRVTTIDYAAATAAGILVSEGRAPDSLPYSPAATPEFAWGLLLATVRHLAAESQRLRQGQWQHTLGLTLAGRTLGLVGLGRIGTRMARYAQAFDMRVIAWSRNLTDDAAREAGAVRVDKQDLFAQSDIVSIHYVLGERSRGLVGAREIAAMKPTAYLVNTSRGPVVDEAALVAALRERHIAGAGLDVFDEEPLPRDHPLNGLDNVTLTPHLGFVTEDNMRRFHAGAALAVAAYLDGRPAHILNPEALMHKRPS
ncbi:D-2-hydroxyacid dehydrogenase family protein [Labrys monachus]|uniref:Phosphoglycerate dehydrogenase-like enzyme n=1 Tax=Labrys monachus TaxID=217067 RepID=A0ABU0FHL3_9HYPH|nr:D-2-hydroxyacid dehydrogenase family protein [Labrys monachus]MDQ0393555.1 phosphoglycerate dehydrogenase-like enzyme [Labrys monachus]